MKALVGAFNQEKALVGAFSVIVQPVVEPMEHYTALASPGHPQQQEQESSGHGGGLHSAGGLQARPLYRGAGQGTAGGDTLLTPFVGYLVFRWRTMQ